MKTSLFDCSLVGILTDNNTIQTVDGYFETVITIELISEKYLSESKLVDVVVRGDLALKVWKDYEKDMLLGITANIESKELSTSIDGRSRVTELVAKSVMVIGQKKEK